MAQYDEDFMEKCENNNLHIDMNQRYVDDDDLVHPSIPAGYKVGETGKVEFRKEWETKDIAEALPDDERTMIVMVNLAN